MLASNIFGGGPGSAVIVWMVAIAVSNLVQQLEIVAASLVQQFGTAACKLWQPVWYLHMHNPNIGIGILEKATQYAGALRPSHRANCIERCTVSGFELVLSTGNVDGPSDCACKRLGSCNSGCLRGGDGYRISTDNIGCCRSIHPNVHSVRLLCLDVMLYGFITTMLRFKL